MLHRLCEWGGWAQLVCVRECECVCVCVRGVWGESEWEGRHFSAS